jgi:plasmid stability protein
MPQLLVRGVEPAVYERLKENAQANGRSLEAEVRHILQQSVRGTRRSFEETEAAIQRIRERLSKPQTTDSVDLIREDRDR